MRVIAGTAKGVRLGKVPEGTRPVSDRAREGLFSSLADEVDGAAVLDLFAGTGALGIEALSRGATSATFVDRSKAAVGAIRDNLDKTKLSEGARVACRPVIGFLRGPARVASLVFLDPPYAIEIDALSQVTALLGSEGWLSQEGWTVALTRPAKSYTPVIPIDWSLAKRLDYGDTLITLYREV
ncbi:MAG: 16S rRNA (guanine(966)-N(2))-methyltransferase RsmD [Actinobacteria bacterium]|nr:16S rRNA (guanine(966)-N(2))-methyltransferase RsmD [Actinomycetota bacterium]